MKISELFADHESTTSRQDVADEEGKKPRVRSGGAFDDVRKSMSEKKKRKAPGSQETPAKGQKRIDTFFLSKHEDGQRSRDASSNIEDAPPEDLLPRTCEEWDMKWNRVVENFKVGGGQVPGADQEPNAEECQPQEPVIDLNASMESSKLEHAEEDVLEAKAMCSSSETTGWTTYLPSCCVDRWDKDHVRMPFSPHNFSIRDGRPRWLKIKESLTPPEKFSMGDPMQNYRMFEQALFGYISKAGQTQLSCKFVALQSVILEDMSEEEQETFFKQTLPFIINTALRLPEFCCDPVELLRSGRGATVELNS
eukprot:766961-Hanusia_phi.AAC.5